MQHRINIMSSTIKKSSKEEVIRKTTDQHNVSLRILEISQRTGIRDLQFCSFLYQVSLQQPLPVVEVDVSSVDPTIVAEIDTLVGDKNDM